MWNVLAELGDTEFTPEEVFLKKNLNSKYLTEDIIYDILVKVPGKDLYNDVRLVCKAWKEMISTTHFVKQHAMLTKPGLLVQEFRTTKVRLMEVEEDQLDYKLHSLDLYRNFSVMSSCNGLILRAAHHKQGEELGNRRRVLEVMNLVTKKCTTLDSCSLECRHGVCGAALVFDPRSNNYKVVHANDNVLEFEIFTLGGSPEESSWRQIPGPWEDESKPPYCFDFYWRTPVVIGGIIHWYVCSEEYILSFDVSSEKFIRTCLPHCGMGVGTYDVIDYDGKLSLIHTYSDTQIDVWIMEDFDSREWFMKHSIIGDQTRYTTSRQMSRRSSRRSKEQKEFPNFSQLIALGSARNGQVLMFKGNLCVDPRFYLYDMKRGELKNFKMVTRDFWKFIPHRSTLHHWR